MADPVDEFRQAAGFGSSSTATGSEVLAGGGALGSALNSISGGSRGTVTSSGEELLPGTGGLLAIAAAVPFAVIILMLLLVFGDR